MENGDKLWGMIYEELRAIRRDLDSLRSEVVAMKSYSDRCNDDRDTFRKEFIELRTKLELLERSKAKLTGLAVGLGMAGGSGAGVLLKLLSG